MSKRVASLTLEPARMEYLRTMIEGLDQMFVHLGDTILGIVQGQHPWVQVLVESLIKVLPIIVLFPAIFAITTWVERKLLGRIQNRRGPNRVGPAGILQPAADGMKTLTKEDIIPARADKFVHTLAPILLLVASFLVITVLPMGRGMTPADLNIGVFFFFAVGSISEVATFLAGWASHNKYSLLGGMRAIAQMISYEIPFILSTVTVIMITGTLSTTQIVESQALHTVWTGGVISHIGQHLWNSIAGWHVFQPWGLIGFILFFIAGLAELNRSPFDIPEAESELIAGHHTEYSGFKFALFAIAEYISMIAVCGLAVTLFLGGWNGPMPVPSWAWFFLKVFFLMFMMIWVRGTLPRLRVDQLMGFAWKFMIPLSLVNIFAAGIWHHIPSRPLGWIVTTLLLLISYQFLARLVVGPTVKKRIYRFAS